MKPEVRTSAVILLFCAIAFLWCGPIATSPAHVAADVGDPMQLAWTMAWVGRAVTHDPLHLFDANSFYPARRSLAMGDHLLPQALLGLPINALSGNAVLALNAVTVFGLVSSAFAGYVLVSRLLRSTNAGLLGGTALAFSTFTQDELLRANVIQLQGWPLALFCLWRFGETRAWRWSLGFAAALLLQGLTGTYYAVYTAFLVPLMFLALALTSPTNEWRASWVRLVIPLLCAGAVGWIFLSPYRGLGTFMLKPIPDGADVAAFILPDAGSALYSGFLPTAPRGETSHFVGYIALAFAGFGVHSAVKSRDSAARFLVICGSLFALAGAFIAIGAFPRFLGQPLGHSPLLSLLQWVPALRGMATVERAGVLVQIGIALLAAVGVTHAFRYRRALAWSLGLVALMTAERWGVPRAGVRIPAGDEVPEVYRWLGAPGRESKEPIVELPVFPSRLLRFRGLYLYFSTYHWRPVPFGRASFYPPVHEYFASLLEDFPSPRSLAALDELGIHDIVIHPRQWEGAMAEKLSELKAVPSLKHVKQFEERVAPSAEALGWGNEIVYRLGVDKSSASTCDPRDEVDILDLGVNASAREAIDRLHDGKLDTVWSTVRTQEEGDFVQVAFDAPRQVSAIRLMLGDRATSFPVDPIVEIRGESGWEQAAEITPIESSLETLRQLKAQSFDAAITLRLNAVTASAVRVRLGPKTKEHGWYAWEIAELRVFGSCSGAEPPQNVSHRD